VLEVGFVCGVEVGGYAIPVVPGWSPLAYGQLLADLVGLSGSDRSFSSTHSPSN